MKILRSILLGLAISFALTASAQVTTSPAVTGVGLGTGGTCTNQFVRSLSATGAPTCASVAAADLSIYTKSTYTPTLTLGGAAVSMTFSSRVGRYQRIADLVCVQGFIELTAKGSSVGVAQVSLPVTAVNVTNANFSLAVVASSLTGTTGGIMLLGGPNATTATLYYSGTGTATAVADTNVQNNTWISFAGCYEV